MRSSARSDRLDLARDLPTTVEDTEALRRATKVRPLDIEAYLRFLDQFPPPTAAQQRAKRGPRAEQPFRIGG